MRQELRQTPYCTAAVKWLQLLPTAGSAACDALTARLRLAGACFVHCRHYALFSSLSCSLPLSPSRPSLVLVVVLLFAGFLLCLELSGAAV